MKLVIEIPDESLGGIETMLDAGSTKVPHPETGAPMLKRQFETAKDYFAHVVAEQVAEANRNYPQRVVAQKAAQIKALRDEMDAVMRPAVKVTTA